jgi:hypothetical protein
MSTAAPYRRLETEIRWRSYLRLLLPQPGGFEGSVLVGVGRGAKDLAGARRGREWAGRGRNYAGRYSRRRGVYRGIWLCNAAIRAPGPVAQLVRAADS